MLRVATDVGGTFTDFIAFDDSSGKLIAAKASTTPNIVEGIIECFRKSGVRAGDARHFIHGSTVAINTVIERKGAVTGLLATEGFRHVLELGRGSIHNSFDLMFLTPQPLAPPQLRYGVEERMLADGSVLRALNVAQACEVIAALVRRGAKSIAICLLHSYANPSHERELAALIRSRHPEIYVSASSDIIRQYREYERTSTTVLNAYVGPRIGAYLEDVGRFLADDGFTGAAMIMQSNGGTMTLDAARQQPVRMMESGPVGGTMAAAYIGRKLGFANVVAFDMGGTTAKVSMVRNGRMEVAEGYFIGGEETGYPLQLPVVDIIEIGAGGGSIAHLDETGALKIGPASAGAYPGPACYARGGAEPTVTDANLVLGRLNAGYFLGGEMQLDAGAAAAAIRERVAAPLGLSEFDAAKGIIKLADLSMAHAVQTMTVQRGYDPRDAVMIAYGGGGPLHAVSVARELGIRKVVIPPYCGIFSALGMLLADAKNEYVVSLIRPLHKAAAAEIDGLFTKLEAEAVPVMRTSGFQMREITAQRALELRYSGQEFTLIVDCHGGQFSESSAQEMTARFNEVYEARYGHAFPNVVPEIVSVRLTLIGNYDKPELALRVANASRDEEAGVRRIYFEQRGLIDCKAVRRDALAHGASMAGPLVIEEASATTLMGPEDRVTVHEDGHLLIDVATGTG